MGIFVLSDIYNKDYIMKIILTEEQYRLIEKYISEARKATEPVILSHLFNDNPNAQFFAITKRMGESDTDYDFKIDEVNGHKMVRDINKNTKTKQCIADLHVDTMIYGNQFKLSFGKCGPLTLDKVVGIKLFANEEDLRANKPMDSMPLEHDLDSNKDDLANKYSESLKSAEIHDEIYLDAIVKGKLVKYDGEVINKLRDLMQLQLTRQGVRTPPFNLNINISENPFYLDGDELFLKGTATSHKGNVGGISNDEKTFVVSIKSFEVKSKQTKSKPKIEKPIANTSNEKQPDAGVKSDGKIAMDMILNDPTLKQAFFQQPSLWNLFKAEMTGKKATGKGILPTIQLVGEYEKNEKYKRLGAEFIENRDVHYRLDNRVVITFKTDEGEETFVREKGQTYVIKIAEHRLGEDIKLVYGNENDKDSYTIYIRKKTDIANVFFCDFVKYDFTKEHKKNIQKDVSVKFLKIDKADYGYKPRYENQTGPLAK